MILKCAKTGRLLFSTQEAQEHAEAFGPAYANFEEVSPDDKVWVCRTTGRSAYTEAEKQKVMQRDPAAVEWEEKTVQYLVDQQKLKEAAAAKKERFFGTVDQKKLEVLATIKGINHTRATKALRATRAVGTIEAAEAWAIEHADEPGIDRIPEEFLVDEIADETTSVAIDSVTGLPVGDTRQEGDPNPPEVVEKVSQELAKVLVEEMGFRQVPAEKSLYLTDSQSLEAAINWLADHAEDRDFNLPLLKPKPPKPKLSKEQAEQKAMDLQKQLAKRRAEEEKLSEKEKERVRIESTKAMVEANEKLHEGDRRRAIETQKREKEEHKAQRAQLKERMRLDYIERFGVEPPPDEEEEVVKDKTSKEQVAFHIGRLKKLYKESDPEGLKTCLATLKAYIKNLADNPQEGKYKKLKLDNKAFQSRVAPFEGAMDLLDVLGFARGDQFLEQRKSIPDGFLCGHALKFLDLILSSL